MHEVTYVITNVTHAIKRTCARAELSCAVNIMITLSSQCAKKLVLFVLHRAVVAASVLYRLPVERKGTFDYVWSRTLWHSSFFFFFQIFGQLQHIEGFAYGGAIQFQQ